jgi:apolipoprotein N-acyltransferase
LILAGIIRPFLSSVPLGNSARRLQIAGVQLEFPDVGPLKQALDKVITTNTNVDLIVLSEYTLDGPPPDLLKNWCRDNQKFLIVGGKDYTTNKNFYDTAFVISTNGDVIFKQVKSVPVQCFKDGLPATEQKCWDSPWGKIGICICYDLSYTRVTDELVRQGAEMLIVPTMDVADWGQHQYESHARIAPVRAAEYGIPIFRLASSGISQGVNRSGRVSASAPFPGAGEMIFCGVNLSPKGSLPLDRYLAPLAVFVTGAFVVWLMVTSWKTRINAPQPPA